MGIFWVTFHLPKLDQNNKTTLTDTWNGLSLVAKKNEVMTFSGKW